MCRAFPFLRCLIGWAVWTMAALACGGSYLDAPQYVGPPLAAHALATRAFQGIPSLAVAPTGRLWATWYAGKTAGEDQNNYAVLATSGDNGATWTDTLVVDPDGEGAVRAFDPEVWVAPDGALYFFWTQAVDHAATTGGVWCVTTSQADSATPAWTQSRRLTDGVMMCKPLVLSTGEWALPASTWRDTDFSARMIVSSDQGQTWSEVAPSAIAHTSARFFIRRLASGNLLLVKHGPIATATGRSLLTAYVSRDDGVTWLGGLLLDAREGVSYPDGQETVDGLIRIIYDYNRTSDRQILMVVFREEDAVVGRAVSGAVLLRQTVSSFYPLAVNVNRGGVPLRQEACGAWSTAAADAVLFETGAQIFSDRTYAVSELPAALQDALPTRNRARFLRLPMAGVHAVSCARSGVVYVLTPSPERNASASQTSTLETLGFERVRLPEVRLLGPSAASGFCTVFQKTCAQGETLTFDAWAVPFYLK